MTCPNRLRARYWAASITVIVAAVVQLVLMHVGASVFCTVVPVAVVAVCAVVIHRTAVQLEHVSNAQCDTEER